jgi:protein-tyrosine phosphatase
VRPTLRSPPIDVSLVAPNLFVGARPPPGRYRWVGVIVLCAREYQLPSYAFPGVTVLHVPLDDDSTRPMHHHEIVLATSNARTMARYLHAGHRVLSTCHMGLNRSALVAGLAMRQAFGMSPTDVIEQIRSQRGPRALSNPRFRQLIHRFA